MREEWIGSQWNPKAQDPGAAVHSDIVGEYQDCLVWFPIPEDQGCGEVDGVEGRDRERES
jgi:hypothetical protein